MTSPVQLEYALAGCLRELVRFVDAQSQSGARDEQAPELAYCLTPKQCDDMDRVCDESGWERLNCYAIMINPSDIRHILTSRSKKDNLDCTQIAEIVAKAYSPRSLVRRNPPTFDPTAAQHPAEVHTERNGLLRHRNSRDSRIGCQKVLGSGDVLSRDRGQETQDTQVTT